MRASATALLVAVFSLASVAAQDIPLNNWSVPQQSSRGKADSNGDVTKASVFVAVTPCRLVDTRNPAGPFGGPSLSAGQTRMFGPAFGPCTGMPSGAIAFSLNFTIFNYNPNAGSFIAAYPGNAARPFVSTVNWGGGAPVANSAVIPVAATPPNVGQIAVYAGAATDLIIDINGYFMDDTGAMNPGTKFSLIGNVANGPVAWIRNVSSTGGIGIHGSIATSVTTESAGVMGTAQAGPTWGVIGSTSAFQNRSGGVFGIAGARVTQAELQPIGVRGDSPYGDGLAGFTSDALTSSGVSGTRMNESGVAETYGLLGTVGYGVFSYGNFAATGTKNFVDRIRATRRKWSATSPLKAPRPGRTVAAAGGSCADAPSSPSRSPSASSPKKRD